MPTAFSRGWEGYFDSEFDDDMQLDPEEENEEHYYDHTRGDSKGHFWMFGDIEGGRTVLPQGVDESIYTDPIYLTNARNPTLTAHFQFNINDGAGLPPDGFRVEISSDDGHSWDYLTQGARAAWNYSGQDDCDYAGHNDEEGYGWVDSHSLQRLDVDLSGWAGERVILRFRVFTNMTDAYADSSLPGAFFMDDVWVTEEDTNSTSTEGTQSLNDIGIDDQDDVETSTVEEESELVEKETRSTIEVSRDDRRDEDPSEDKNSQTTGYDHRCDKVRRVYLADISLKYSIR